MVKKTKRKIKQHKRKHKSLKRNKSQKMRSGISLSIKDLNNNMRGGTKYKEIGQGSYGCAYEFINHLCQKMILKVSLYDGSDIQESYKKELQNELLINQKLLEESRQDESLKDHLVIMTDSKLIDKEEMKKNYDCNAQKIHSSSSNLRYLLLEMPYGGVQLYDSITDKLDDVLKNFIDKVLKSLKKLHELGIVHGDCHPSNILIDNSDPQNVKVRLCDFGKSREINETNKTSIIDSLVDLIGLQEESIQQFLTIPDIEKILDLLRFIRSLKQIIKEKKFNLLGRMILRYNTPNSTLNVHPDFISLLREKKFSEEEIIKISSMTQKEVYVYFDPYHPIDDTQLEAILAMEVNDAFYTYDNIKQFLE